MPSTSITSQDNSPQTWPQVSLSMEIPSTQVTLGCVQVTRDSNRLPNAQMKKLRLLRLPKLLTQSQSWSGNQDSGCIAGSSCLPEPHTQDHSSGSHPIDQRDFQADTHHPLGKHINIQTRLWVAATSHEDSQQRGAGIWFQKHNSKGIHRESSAEPSNHHQALKVSRHIFPQDPEPPQLPLLCVG